MTQSKRKRIVKRWAIWYISGGWASSNTGISGRYATKAVATRMLNAYLKRHPAESVEYRVVNLSTRMKSRG